MKEYTIKIGGVPEGWEPVAVRIAVRGEHVLDCGSITLIDTVDETKFPCLIVRKTKPRRIVLEETDEVWDMTVPYYIQTDGLSMQISSNKIWKEVKE